MATAVFPVAAGYPVRSGIMVPEIWSPQLLYKFYLATVFGEICNTDYEGLIQDKGDTVHVRTTPDIVINDYEDGQPLDFQQPEPTLIDFVIDKGKYWAINDTYITQKQADYAYLEDWMADGAARMRITIDSSVLSTTYAYAGTYNKGATAGRRSQSYNLGAAGSPVAITKTNAIEFLQDIASVMSEQDLPDESRWVVLPEWYINLLGKSDIKDASFSGDEVSVVRNGRVGKIADMRLYRSNQLPTTADGSGYTAYNIIAGHKCATTFASQLVRNEGPMKHPSFFGDFYRGLNVYGFKTMKEEALVHAYVRKG